MYTVLRFVKKNKILVVVGAVVLLAVILTLSLYYGLKKSPASSPTSNPSDKFINIDNVEMNILSNTDNTNNIILNTEGYNTNNIYIKIKDINVQSIDLSNVERTFLEIVRLISRNDLNKNYNTRNMNFIVFTEVMNSINRKLVVSSYNSPDIGNNTIEHGHNSYINDTNKIDIEIKLTRGVNNIFYDYKYVVSTNINSKKKVLYSYTDTSLLLKKIDNIVFNVEPILTNGAPINSELYMYNPFITILSEPSKFPNM